MPKIDMIGRKFGKLTVIGPAKSHGTKAYWMCLCECGTVKEIRGQLLRSGRAQSCGCGKGFKHGFCTGGRPKRIYNIWKDMRSRCQNPKNIGFKLYGGRGISVCKEWEDFQTFQKWASSAGYSDDLTLDRKDPDGDYSPGNCRWISNDEQQRNRRNNVQITIRREQEEARRRAAQEEMNRKLEEAELAESNGDTVGAEMAMAEAEVMEGVSAGTTQSFAPKAKGVSRTKTWKIKSIDSTKVPVSFAGVEIRPVDEKLVLQLIKMSKGKISIPGVEYEEDVIIGIR